LFCYPHRMKLSFDAFRCEIKPELGGCISGLWWADVPVLQSTPAHQLESVRLAASYPLLPFSNRVAYGVLQWQGKQYPLCKNWPPDLHAIHGVGWERPWRVLDQTPHSALLGYQHTPDDFWPFAFDATQSFTLSAQGLAMSLSITNRADHTVPVGLGWHPFFVKRPGCHIRFAAQGCWEMDADALPTHCLPSAGLDTPVDTLTVDHCFDTCTGEVLLQDALITSRITSTVPHLVVYTHPGRGDIAIEPVSHINNAFNRAAQDPGSSAALGVVELAPGANYSCAMRIVIEPTTKETPAP
jgi:aldose 1-epimerase